MPNQVIQEMAVLISCGISALLIVLAAQDFLFRHLTRLSLWHFVLAFIILRLLAIVAIYGVYHFQHHGDLGPFSGYVQAVSQGKLPYVDYVIDYGVLFPHLLWLATLGTGNMVLMVLFFTLCDCLAFVVGDRLLSRDGSAEVVTLYRILYVLCPLSWFLVVGFGQEEPILALLGELALFASLASLDVWGGILVGVALAVTKSMFGIYAYVAWLVSRKKAAFLAAAIVATVILHYAYLIRGVIPFPFREYHNSPPSVNIWTVLFPNPPGSAISFWVFPLLLLAVVLCSFIYAHQQFKPKASLEGVSILIVANFLAFMVFSPKSLQPYRLVFVPFLFMYMASRIASRRSFVYVVAVYSLALSVHYTFWEDWVYRYGYFASIQGVLVYVMLCVAVAVEVLIFVDVLRRLISGMRGFAGKWAC